MDGCCCRNWDLDVFGMGKGRAEERKGNTGFMAI